MATTTIPWGDGSGDNIYLTYPSASGDQTVEVSSDANTGSARSKVVTFSTGNVTQVLTVNQATGLQPVFYSRLLFDGVAYIDTDIYPEANSSYTVGLGMESLKSAQRIFIVDSDNNGYCGALMDSSTDSTNRQIAPYYDSSALAARALLWTAGGYSYFLTPKGHGWGNSYQSFTKGNTQPNGRLILGSFHGHTGNPYSGVMGAFSIYGSEAQDVTNNADFSNFTRKVYLRPCKLDGESGFWNVYEGKFYGNSAASGSLRAVNYASFSPSSYDTSNYSYYNLSNPSNAYGGYSNTTYAQIGLTRGSRAETYVYFKFDTSSIPADATIARVICSAKGYISNQSANISTRHMQLFCGTTAKGTAKSIGTTASAYEIYSGTLTREELSDVRIRIYAKRATSNVNTNYYARFYGATLWVLYD